MESKYQPAGCEHKLPNGLSAWVLQSEESGSGPEMYFDVHVCVCKLCGTVRVGGFRQDKHGKLNKFSEEIDLHAAEAIDAIVKYANYIHGEEVWGRLKAQPGATWPLYVIDKKTGDRHEVWKMIYDGLKQTHIWSHSWYGHHKIGYDCEWAATQQSGAVWVKASEFKYVMSVTYHAYIGVTKGAGWFDTVEGDDIFNWSDGGDTLQCQFKDLYILDESAAAIQIDREWINSALVDFALSYHCSNNKDIANDAAEYLNDKLKDAGIEYVLSEEESAAGREEVDVDELWDEHAEYIDDNIDELIRWAGCTVVTREQFNKMMAKFKQQKEK